MQMFKELLAVLFFAAGTYVSYWAWQHAAQPKLFREIFICAVFSTICVIMAVIDNVRRRRVRTKH